MSARRRRAGRRLLRWLWTSRRADARAARALLVPVSAGWRLLGWARDAAYARGLARTWEPPVPAVAVGNLTLGRSGTAPLSAWVAEALAELGRAPALVVAEQAGERVPLGGPRTRVRVYGGPERRHLAEMAFARGADTLVFDDAFPARDLARTLTLLAVSTESSAAVPWAPPAGPWREGRGAMREADLLVVTRKRADAEMAEAVAAALWAESGRPVARAFLGVREVEPLRGGARRPVEELAGRRVIAAAGARDPDGVVAGAKAAGAAVQAAPWRGGVAADDADIAWLARAARKADLVVVGPRDARRLRQRWPDDAPEPLVAVTGVHWEAGEAVLRALLADSFAPTP